MSAQVLLLRGVNVGGRGRLPMADLRALLIGLGAGEARTYIQSGNAVVARAVDPQALADRIEAGHGFRPGIVALTAGEWLARLAARPFPEDPRLHLFFSRETALPDLAPLRALAGPTEEIAATPGVIWLKTPNGIGRSKLATAMERTTGRSLTARNWRTVTAIGGMLDAL